MRREAALVWMLVVVALSGLGGLTALALADAPARPGPQTLSAATPEARELACTQGLPALAFTKPRARVLADGATAVDLVRACSATGGVRTLDVAEAGATSARAQARARRMALGAERYDLIVIAPEQPASPASMLTAVLPHVPSETVEGMHELLAALASDGALFGLVTGEPSALRFALTAMDALRLDGSNHPTTRIVVQRAVDRYGVWVGRGTMPMDTLLELHARDRGRRVAGADPHAPSLPAWAASTPTLLHTAVALFDERVSRVMRQHELEPASSQPPVYAFDIAPLHDERPLFFELARWDRPDTWVDGSRYLHALELLGSALLACVVIGWLELRTRRLQGRGGLREVAARQLWVISAGALLAWSAQAMSRLLADAGSGSIAAVAGLVLGGVAGWWAARPTLRRSVFVTLAAVAAELALALAAWRWTSIVASTDTLSSAQGVALSVTTSALLGAAAGVLVPRREARPGTRALTLGSYAGGLLASFAVVAVSVLFGDFRALGLLAAATGLLSVALASRAGVGLHGSATTT